MRIVAEWALLPEGWARDVVLTTDGGRFVAVEPGADAAGATRAPGPVLPGLANLHSHAFQRAMAGLTEIASGEDDFWSWRERMYAFLARLTPEAMQAVARQLYVEMLEAGYTGVAEFHYVHHQPDGRPYADRAETSRRLIAAAAETGIAITHLPVLYAASDFGGKAPNPGQRRFLSDAEGLLEVVEALRLAHAADPLVRIGIAPHSLRAVPPAMLDDLLRGFGAIDPEGPVHIHIAEQLREVEACRAWSGARPVEWLLGHAAVDRRWCLVHATHLAAEERRTLAASGAVAGLCPSTEANLGDGLFPLVDYLAEAGRFGIGSDSHVTIDAAEELRLLEYGQRLTRRRRAVSVAEGRPSIGTGLLLAAAAGGAQALGQPTGRLAAGARADLVILGAAHPTLAGRTGDTIADSFVFAAGRETPVREVWVAGRRVVADGRHPGREAARAGFRDAMAVLLG
jgi:formimidoylglutamate deiminase